jgi:3-phosphoshikimate 1-carboxyvinyltransferase
MASPQSVTVRPTRAVKGRVRPPGDKSISHRFAIFAALADGRTTIRGYSTGADCRSTLTCLQALGVRVTETGRDTAGLQLSVEGRGLGGLVQPSDVLDAGNSGSTLRMLAGVLAAHPFATSLTGDESLRRRPMRRIIVPLQRMGCRIDSSDDGRPPITIEGTAGIRPIAFTPDVPSAQVKSAVLLAGLHADGITSVTESLQTRDHTERGLRAFGVDVLQDGRTVRLQGRQRLSSREVEVPGDVSSAAFWMAAAASLPGSEIVIDGVGLNPTRSGIVDVLRRMGASIEVEGDVSTPGEPVGRLVVRHGGVGAAEVLPAEVPGVIDELPVLAALATAGGELRVSGAQELRVKESDRISALADGIRRMGGHIEEQADGFHVDGRRPLRGGEVDARHDHRLAMAFAVAALGATGPTIIHDAGAAAVSYPEFFDVLDAVRA